MVIFHLLINFLPSWLEGSSNRSFSVTDTQIWCLRHSHTMKPCRWRNKPATSMAENSLWGPHQLTVQHWDWWYVINKDSFYVLRSEKNCFHCVHIKPQNHDQENPKAKLIWNVLEGGQIHFGWWNLNLDTCTNFTQFCWSSSRSETHVSSIGFSMTSGKALHLKIKTIPAARNWGRGAV